MAWATFDQLKRALYEALMLALPNFHKVFVLEINVCAIGLGAVLSQEV